MTVERNMYDDPALAKIRKDQKDPLVAYLVVRTDLDMGVGKVVAQCSHASNMMVLRLKHEMSRQPEMWSERVRFGASWLHGSFRLIVKVAKKQSDFDKLKEDLDVFVVRDAGLTEVKPMTETVLCTWPMYKSQTPKRLVRMRLLKCERFESSNLLSSVQNDTLPLLTRDPTQIPVFGFTHDLNPIDWSVTPRISSCRAR